MTESMAAAWPALALPILLGIVVVFAVAIWSIKRHRDPTLRIDCNAPIEELLPSLAGLTLGTPVQGNSVEVFENGAFFDVLLQEIAAARHSVHFETFLWKDGVLGRRVADALSASARAHRAQRAGGVQRELGGGNRRALPRRRRLPPARARRRDHDARRLREAGGLGARREAPAPRRDLLRQEADLDPEPLLHSRARGHRRLRPGRRPRRRRAP